MIMFNNISQHCEPCSSGRNVSFDAIKYCSDCEESYCETCSINHKAQKATKNHSLTNIEECLDKTTSLSVYCEPCAENDNIFEAVSRCVECTESYCENCARIHKSQKATRNHEITMLELEMKRSVCEACSYSGDESRPSSTMCLTCDEALCCECTKAHRSQKATRKHQIKDQQEGNLVSPRLESGRISTQRGTFCDHCNELNKVTLLSEAFRFCFSCRQSLCETCASDHKSSIEGRTHRLVYSSEEESRDESQVDKIESSRRSSYESISYEIENISTPGESMIPNDKFQKRKQIEDTAGILLPNVEHWLNKIADCRSEIAVLEKFKAQMMENKDFRYKRKRLVQNLIPLRKGLYTKNCLHCNVTCHDNCELENGEDNAQCAAMDNKGYCTVCEDHCYWNIHKNTPFIIEWKEVEEDCTYDEMMKKYQTAEAEVISHEAIVDKTKKDLDEAENEMLNLMKKIIADCSNQLSQISFTANPLSVAEHIDVIIENEKWKRKLGFQDRINNLEKLKRKIAVGDEFKHFQRSKEDIYK